MSRPIGTVYNIPPQPPVDENTRWFPAGNLEIGVEYRDVDPDGLIATYKDDPALLTEVLERSPEGGFYDEGVSIHVRSSAGGHEYLRFDVFDGEPHYHYIHPGDEPVNHIVDYDVVSNGDMLTWALDRLKTRLPEMLAEAGGVDLVADLDPTALAAALTTTEELAKKAQETARALRAATQSGSHAS